MCFKAPAHSISKYLLFHQISTTNECHLLIKVNNLLALVKQQQQQKQETDKIFRRKHAPIPTYDYLKKMVIRSYILAKDLYIL